MKFIDYHLTTMGGIIELLSFIGDTSWHVRTGWGFLLGIYDIGIL